MGAALRVDPQQPGATTVAVAAYTWRGSACDVAVHAVAGGARRIARSRWSAPDRRELWHYEWRDGRLSALDHTVFHAGDGVFSEAERYRAAGGPNLHPRPIPLPAELRVGEAVAPWADAPARVTLVYAGRVRLTQLDRVEEIDAIRLDATDGVVTRAQWLARGVGEIALGPPDGPWERALVAWSGGGDTLFGGAPAELVGARYPDLPAVAPAAAPGGLW